MDKAIDLFIRHGQFIIRPLKQVYRRRLAVGEKQAYHAWAIENEQCCFVNADDDKVAGLISVVVPVYNTDPTDLLSMVYSVVNQHYENWELILVDASTDPIAKKRVKDCSQIDTRIKVVATTNEGIAANTNKGINVAEGRHIAFLDHDDVLHACALHCIAQAIIKHKGELIYSDEDKISADSTQYFQPFFKPGWSPNLLRNVNYINHLTVIKTELIKRVGGLREDFDGAQDYDLLLRVIDVCQPNIVHVPRVLYHWRAALTSTARNFATKDYVLKAGTKAVDQHLERSNLEGKAKAIKNQPGFYAINYGVPDGISVVVGPVHRTYYRICAVWMNELAKQLPQDLEIEWVVGDWYNDIFLDSKLTNVKTVPSDAKDYWQLAGQNVKFEAVICFQSGAFSVDRSSLTQLTAAALRLNSFIAPVILNARSEIIDAGLVESPHGLQELFSGYKLGMDSYYGTTHWNRDVAALTMQIFAAPKELFKVMTSQIDGQELNALTIASYRNKNPNTGFVSYAHTPFVYKGTFTDPPLMNNAKFNPQLDKSRHKVGILHSNWAKLKEISERDNAE